MNNPHPRTQSPAAASRRHLREGGNSLIEVAISLPILIWLLLGIANFSGVFNRSIELTNAARAGAQYGSRSVSTAADTTGMVDAAKQDAPDLSAISVSASQCTCATGSSVAACAPNYCTNNPSRTFVTVNTSLTYNTIVSFPGLPSSYALTGKAVMEVGQ